MSSKASAIKAHFHVFRSQLLMEELRVTFIGSELEMIYSFQMRNETLMCSSWKNSTWIRPCHWILSWYWPVPVLIKPWCQQDFKWKKNKNPKHRNKGIPCFFLEPIQAWSLYSRSCYRHFPFPERWPPLAPSRRCICERGNSGRKIGYHVTLQVWRKTNVRVKRRTILHVQYLH